MLGRQFQQKLTFSKKAKSDLIKFEATKAYILIKGTAD